MQSALTLINFASFLGNYSICVDKTWEQGFQLVTVPNKAAPIVVSIHSRCWSDFFSKITWWSIIQGCQTGHENVAANIEFHYFRELIRFDASGHILKYLNAVRTDCIWFPRRSHLACKNRRKNWGNKSIGEGLLWRKWKLFVFGTVTEYLFIV